MRKDFRNRKSSRIVSTDLQRMYRFFYFYAETFLTREIVVRNIKNYITKDFRRQSNIFNICIINSHLYQKYQNKKILKNDYIKIILRQIVINVHSYIHP